MAREQARVGGAGRRGAFLVAAVWLTDFSTACSRQHSPRDFVAGPATSSAGAGSDEKGTTLALTVGPCYGPCAVYALTFRADGTVEYDGKSYVAARGRRTVRITEEAFSALVRRFDALHSETLTWNRECPEKFVTDHSTLRTSITRAGKSHVIDHNLGDGCAPDELVSLEKALIDAPGASLQEWTHCDAGFCPP